MTKQEINDEGGIDLGQHGVFRVADEGLDLQVLLDEAEEDLDLPTFFVDIGDQCCPVNRLKKVRKLPESVRMG